jgi:hypothetical protein
MREGMREGGEAAQARFNSCLSNGLKWSQLEAIPKDDGWRFPQLRQRLRRSLTTVLPRVSPEALETSPRCNIMHEIMSPPFATLGYRRKMDISAFDGLIDQPKSFSSAKAFER